jgi:hypothetical protein
VGNSGFHKPSGPRYLPVLRNYGTVQTGDSRNLSVLISSQFHIALTAGHKQIWILQGTGKLQFLGLCFPVSPLGIPNLTDLLTQIPISACRSDHSWCRMPAFSLNSSPLCELCWTGNPYSIQPISPTISPTLVYQASHLLSTISPALCHHFIAWIRHEWRQPLCC